MSKVQKRPEETFSVIATVVLGADKQRHQDPETIAALDAKLAEWRLLRSMVVPMEIRSLMRAFELGKEENWEIAITDVERIEATWEQLDCFSTAHGFVLSLIGGQRAYLVYMNDNEAEEVTLDPMGKERFPVAAGADQGWSDDVNALNALLTS